MFIRHDLVWVHIVYILVMLCEISNFIVAVPMRTVTAPEICEAIMENFIGYFGTPTRIVCDQDPALCLT